MSAISQKNPKLKAAALQILQVQPPGTIIVAVVLTEYTEAKLAAGMPDMLPLMREGLRSAGVRGCILQGGCCKDAC